MRTRDRHLVTELDLCYRQRSEANRLAFRTTAAVAKAVAIGFAPPPRVVPAKKGICQNPVDYLLEHTHENPAVRELARAVLAPLADELGQRRYIRSIRLDEHTVEAGHQSALTGLVPSGSQLKNYTGSSHRSRQTSSQDAGAARLARAKQQLTGLLVDVMEGREQPGSGSLVTRILAVFDDRYYQVPEGKRIYLAGLAATRLVRPQTADAQTVAFGLVDQHVTVREIGDYARVRLVGPTVPLALLTAKQLNINPAAVVAKKQEIEEDLKRATRAAARVFSDEHSKYASDLERFHTHSLPNDLIGVSRIPNWLGEAVEQIKYLRGFRPDKPVFDSSVRGYYAAHLAQFEQARFAPVIYQQVTDPFFNMGDYVREHGEDTVAMSYLWNIAKRIVYGVDLKPDACTERWRTPFEADSSGIFGFPLIVKQGLWLSTTIHAVSELAKAGARGWGDYVDHFPWRMENIARAQRDGWQPVSFPQPRYDGVEICAKVDEIVRRLRRYGKDNHPKLTAALLYYKAVLTVVHDQNYADHVLPDDVLCPPGEWPNLRPGGWPATSQRAIPPAPGAAMPITVIGRELQELVKARKSAGRLLPTGINDRKWQFELACIRTNLTPAQRTAATTHFQQILMGTTDSDAEVGLRYEELLDFPVAVHRLCVLLAKEPIEVSAGPQEEHQQTTADVTNEVERQLTQLDTGEAYHALLQEDGTINADKIMLLPPPPLPPDNPTLIEKIRRRSKQRFSRSRAEIDAATLRRQDTTTGTAASPQPSQTQQPSPGAGTPPPNGQRPHPSQTPQSAQQPQPPPDRPIGRRS